MLEEIILKYSDFHDSKVSKIHFIDENDKSNLELIISCMNSQNEYKFEKIKVFFSDIDFFNFHFKKNIGILTLYACLFKIENELIVVDFDCIYLDENILKENPNSEFIIKCKEISYEVLSSE